MLEKKNFIASFEEIGLFDPFVTNNRVKTEKKINEISLFKNIYPDKLMDEDRPPKCVFLPDKAVFRKIIKMQIKYQDVWELRQKFERPDKELKVKAEVKAE